MPGYTIRDMARLIGIDPSWIYRAIGRGQILIGKDDRYGCYLCPETSSSVDQMKQLKNDKVSQVSFPKEHRDG